MRSLFALTVAFLVLLVGGSALGAPVSSEWQALPAALEGDLDGSERELLEQVNRLPPAEFESCLGGAPCPKLPAEWSERLGVMVRRLAGIGGWRATALRTLIAHPRFLPLSDRRKTADDAVTALVADIPAKAGCAEVRGAVLEYVRDRGAAIAPAAPITRMNLEAVRGGKSCLEKGSAAKLDRHVLLAVFAADDDEILVVSAGSSPEVITVPRAHSFTLPQVGRRVFLVAVQRDVWTTVQLRARSSPVPRIWPSFTADSDDALWGSPSALTCLDLRIELPTDGVVLIDGARIPSSKGVIHVPFDDHTLVVLRKVETGYAVLSSRPIKSQSVRGLVGCHAIKLDASDKDAIALFQILADPDCAAAGVDSNRLNARVERFLKESNRTTRDIQAWARAVRGFDELRSGLMRLGGGPAGAPRDRGDSIGNLATAGHELLRQGFSDLLSVELHCTERADHQLDFTLAAQRIDLQKLEDAPRDPLVGIDLSRARVAHVEAVHSRSLLGGGLVATLSRVFALDYVRFAEENDERAFESVYHRVEAFTPTKPPLANVVLRAQRLADDDVLRICPSVDADEELRSTDAARPNEPTVEVHRRGFDVKALAPSRLELLSRPQSSGTYLVEAELVIPAKVAPDAPSGRSAFRCVRIVEPRIHAWVNVGYGVNVERLTPAHDARRGSIGYFHAIAGLAMTARENGNIQLGIAVGYGRAVHHRDVPPSWDDVGLGAPSTRSGQSDLTWTRQSFLIGPTFGLHVAAFPCELYNLLSSRHEESGCRGGFRAFGFLLRGMPAIDAGVVDTSEVPSSLRTFVNRNSTFNLDVSLFGETGITFRVSKHTSLYGLFTSALPGLNDLIFNSADQSRITYDGALMLGGTGGVQWEP